MEKAQLDAAWLDGFEKKPPAHDTSLQREIDTFVALFAAARQNDMFCLDQIGGGATRATINGELRSEIDTPEFYPALIAIWIGDAPVTGSLRRAPLGSD